MTKQNKKAVVISQKVFVISNNQQVLYFLEQICQTLPTIVPNLRLTFVTEPPPQESMQDIFAIFVRLHHGSKATNEQLLTQNQLLELYTAVIKKINNCGGRASILNYIKECYTEPENFYQNLEKDFSSFLRAFQLA